MKRLLVCFVLICAGEYALAQQKTVRYDLQQLLADRKITVINREASAVADGNKTGVKLSARDKWFHAKIVVAYPQVSVYVNGNPQASLAVKMLGTAKTGKLSLWVGNSSDGAFANLTVVE